MYKFLCSLLLLLPVFLMAQSTIINKRYTIQVGTFYQPKLTDFTAIQPIGQIYASNKEREFQTIFLGFFKDARVAQNALTSVKKNGYNAFITKDKKGPALDWLTLEQTGKVSALLEDPRLLKVVVGPFTNRIAAQNKLAQLKTVGYQDAFIKTIDAQLLKPLFQGSYPQIIKNQKVI